MEKPDIKGKITEPMAQDLCWTRHHLALTNIER